MQGQRCQRGGSSGQSRTSVTEHLKISMVQLSMVDARIRSASGSCLDEPIPARQRRELIFR